MPVGPDDLYCLIYTSGTTGHPKGVILTLANIIAHVEQSMVASSFGRRPGARALVATPLHHAAGALRIATAAINGTTVVLLDRFDPLPFVETLERKCIATCNMVPSMIARLLDEVPDIAARDFSALEVIHILFRYRRGAAPGRRRDHAVRLERQRRNECSRSPPTTHGSAWRTRTSMQRPSTCPKARFTWNRPDRARVRPDARRVSAPLRGDRANCSEEAKHGR